MSPTIAVSQLTIVDELSRRGFFAAGAAAAASILTACGDDAANTAGSDNGRDVEHALGTTRIDHKPDRVLIASDFLDLEIALGVGIRPIAYGNTGSWERGVLPWQAAAGIGDIDSFASGVDTPVEQIARRTPDLIIGMKSYVEKSYAELSKIAPVIALDWTTPWRDAVALVGKATYADEQSARALSDTAGELSTAKDTLAGLGGKRIMVGSYFGDKLWVQGPTSPLGTLLTELGLNYQGHGEKSMTSMSLEDYGVLRPADILLSLATDPASTQKLEEFDGFRSLPAVRNRAYAAISTVDANAIVDNFGPLSAPHAMKTLTALLPQLAAGQGRQIG